MSNTYPDRLRQAAGDGSCKSAELEQLLITAAEQIELLVRQVEKQGELIQSYRNLMMNIRRLTD